MERDTSLTRDWSKSIVIIELVIIFKDNGFFIISLNKSKKSQ